MPLTSPTTTPLPDEIYDVWAPRLGAAELKVLLYIVRRTLGFRKGSDAISLTQFCTGIVTRDGRVLDHGCGVASRPNVVRALKRLDEKGLIHVSKTRTTAGDKDVTVYALRWENDENGGTTEGGIERTLRWCRSDQEVVSEQNHGSVAATLTTNSVSTNRQQNSMTPGASTHPDRACKSDGPTSAAGDPLWHAVLDDLRETMTANNFAMWFAGTVAEPREGLALTVLVPTPRQHHWLDIKLRSRVEQAMHRLGHTDTQVVFRVVP